MSTDSDKQDAQQAEQAEAQMVASLQDAKQSLLRIRVVTSELDSGITNVNRGNPMLARALRDKVAILRDEIEVMDLFLSARTTVTKPTEDTNGSEGEEKQSSSENETKGTETTKEGGDSSTSTKDTGGGLASDNNGAGTTKSSDNGNDDSKSSNNSVSKNDDNTSSTKSNASGIAAKLKERKEKQKDNSNES